MDEILFTEKEIYDIDRYLQDSLRKSISEKDEMYQKLKKVLIQTIKNNNIEYNNDVSGMIDSIIKKVQISVMNKENIKSFLTYYRFDKSKEKDIIEEISQFNISFDNIDNYDLFKKNCLNQISSLSAISKLFIIECFTNVDKMHNPISSCYTIIFDEVISDQIKALAEFLPTLAEQFIAYDNLEMSNTEENIKEDNGNTNDSENDINGFGDWEDIDFEEWYTSLESKETSLESEETSHKEFLKNMIELFLILPSISKIIENIKQLNKELFEEKNKLYFEIIKNLNPKYIKELLNIMDHNKQANKYYYHGAPSSEIANQIMHEGLYMQYNDINRTARSELNPIELLNYSYGHDNVGRHVVVIIDQPNGDYVVQHDNSGKILTGTGQGLEGYNNFNANYVIPTKYIVGFVDKDNEKIVYNPKYYKFQINQISSQQEVQSINNPVDFSDFMDDAPKPRHM